MSPPEHATKPKMEGEGCVCRLCENLRFRWDRCRTTPEMRVDWVGDASLLQSVLRKRDARNVINIEYKCSV
jgi:hypothetical protein